MINVCYTSSSRSYLIIINVVVREDVNKSMPTLWESCVCVCVCVCVHAGVSCTHILEIINGTHVFFYTKPHIYHIRHL